MKSQLRKAFGLRWEGPATAANYQWKKSCPSVRGIYRFSAFEAEKPRSIARICGIDPTGTLYIGTAPKKVDSPRTLRDRIDEFMKACGCGKGHSAGNRYFRILTVKEFAPVEALYVYWIAHEEPWMLERRALDEYERKFGELPPLNCSGHGLE